MAPTDLATGPPLLLKATAAMYAQDTGAPKLTKAQKRQAAKSKQAMMIWLPVVIVVNAIYGYFGVASRVQSVSVLEWILTALSLAGHWYAYASILESWSEAKVSSAKARSEEKGGAGQDGVDLLALVSVAQLGSLFHPYFWLAILVYIGMVAWRVYQVASSAMGMLGGAAAAAEEDGPKDTRTKAQRKADEEAREKKRAIKAARKRSKHMHS